MIGSQRGNLVLESVPDQKVEEEIVSYLQGLRQDSSRESLIAKVREAPTILFKDISADRGCQIAAELKELGATTFFFPFAVEEEPVSESPPDPPPGPTIPKNFKVQPLRKRKKRKGLQWALLLLLLLILSALLAWQYSSLPVLLGFNFLQTPESIPKPSPESPAYFPDRSRNPTVMEVDPQNLLKGFLHQYRLRPDQRFIMAFEILANRLGDYRGIQSGLSPFQMGEVLSNGQEIVIPLLKEKQPILNLKLPLPLTFPQVMAALHQWLEAMVQIIPKPDLHPIPEDQIQDLEKIDQEILGDDPRSLIFNLMRLEDLRNKVGPDPRIIRSAARAHSLLLTTLYPDPLNHTDSLAAETISLLALAKWFDPQIPLVREEALLAMTMGYTAHAAHLFQKAPPESLGPDDQKMAAFMRKDLEGLRALEGQGSKVLDYYLPARLFREAGLREEAGKWATKLINDYPLLYPARIECIYSGELALAKTLCTSFPADIVAHMERGFSPDSIRNEKAGREKTPGSSKAMGSEILSFTQFEGLMDKWRPLGQVGPHGLLIDEKRIKTIFRTLYTAALAARFHLLHHRWAVTDQTQYFVDQLASWDKDHPLIMEMKALVYTKTGKRREADALLTKIINLPDGPIGPVKVAYSKLEDPLNRINLAPVVTHKLDSRPGNLFSIGTLFQQLHNLDLAETFFSLDRDQDPFRPQVYTGLAQVTGNDAPLSSALTRYPSNISLLVAGGNYFAGKPDPVSKETALKTIDMALKLVPASIGLVQEKALILTQLKRQAEAVQILKNWINEAEKESNNTMLFKIKSAEIYLEMKKPDLALKMISKELASFQPEAMLVGARAYENLGQVKKAEETYRRLAGRYSTIDPVLSGTAAFYWRQGRDAEAAGLIAQGRKTMTKSPQWYFKDFLEVFGQSTENRIKKAMGFLTKGGLTPLEISNLASHFEQRNRPEVAFMLLKDFPPTAFGGRLDHFINTCRVLKKWKGEKEANYFLKKEGTVYQKMPLIMALARHGLFEQVLFELNNPGSYPSSQKDFFWLQRLIAWLALEKKADETEKELTGHYKEKWLEKVTGNTPPDPYHAIGLYLFGSLPRQKLLSLIQTPKQRCLFSYYIGLSERLKSNFTGATHWYHICLETLLQSNEEFQKASDELTEWARKGIKNRFRLPGEDLLVKP